MGQEDTSLLQQIHTDLKLLTAKVESAFPKDDENNVDYIGHRLFHKQQRDSEKDFRENKNAVFRSIVIWASIGLMTVVSTAIADVYIVPLLKAIKSIS